MTFLPPFTLSVLVPLLVAGVVLLGWLAWRSVRGLSAGRRNLLFALRMLVILGLAFCALNPGRWRAEEEVAKREWLVLVDRSASMQTNEGANTRWETAQDAASKLVKEVSATLPIRLETFGSTLDPSLEENELGNRKADATATDVAGSVTSALTSQSASGAVTAGVVIYSDGRSTVETPLQEAITRARALNAPIHTVAIGGSWKAKDLMVAATRRQVLSFPGQDAQLVVQVSAQGLGALRPAVILHGPDGVELQRKEIDLLADASEAVVFTVKATDAPVVYSLSVAAMPEENQTTNNKDTIRLLPLKNKTRVFLAEGAPYWDSKFLAQLLRQQAHLEVMSVHRLSETRYFKISSDKSAPEETSTDVFPNSMAEISAYDLIVFGKGAEHFLTPERIELVRSFVRDQGGAVFFSRGKSYAGKFAELEPLEPVVWAEGKSGDFRFVPTAAGEAAGVFGQVLPGMDAPVWATLPLLRDAHQVDSVKSFTRVLAHGQMPGATGATFPLLTVRRYGQGVAALLNADGLWKWDFFPDAKAQGNMYAEFWAQMIQWMATYSEFLPGQEYSMRLSAVRARQGDRVNVSVGYRGKKTLGEDGPIIHVRDAAGVTLSKIATASAQGEDGRKIWRGTISGGVLGTMTLRLESATGEILSGPEPAIMVTAPPGEMENLQPDPVLLQKLSDGTGGKTWAAADLLAQAGEVMKPPPPVARDGRSEWQPLWNRAWLALLFVGLFAAEWAVRRRSGMV